MPSDRRAFRRETEEARRDTLIAATLELVAEVGARGATVRAIADRAGVTPGLIRHYFAGKDDLIRAAYQSHVDGMTQNSVRAAAAGGPDPADRLAAFVGGTLTPPVTSTQSVGRWAGLLHMILADPEMRAVHEAGYLHFRDLLQELIADLPRARDAQGLRADAIACNAVIDGLWLEASVLPDSFAPGEIVEIGLRAVWAFLAMPCPGQKTSGETP